RQQSDSLGAQALVPHARHRQPRSILRQAVMENSAKSSAFRIETISIGTRPFRRDTYPVLRRPDRYRFHRKYPNRTPTQFSIAAGRKNYSRGRSIAWTAVL